MKKICTLLTLILGISFIAGCGHKLVVINNFIHDQTSDLYIVKDSLTIEEKDVKALIAKVKAKKAVEINVSGTLDVGDGDVSLIYTYPFGKRIEITQSEGGIVDQNIDLGLGIGKFSIVASHNYNTCDFDLAFQIIDGVSYNDGMNIFEKFDENTDALFNFNLDGPIVNNWPEDIHSAYGTFESEETITTLVVDSSMTIKIDCTTHKGTIDMKIIDADGNVYFDETNMPTKEYEVVLDKLGNYRVLISAHSHVGSFKITQIP